MKNNRTAEFESPGFIVGVERSGTTLLSAIINRHSQICVIPETHFFRYLYNYRRGLKGFKKDWPASLDSIVQKMDPTPSWQPSSGDIIKGLKNASKEPGIDEIFKALGDSIAENRNKKFWLEKTPYHISYLKQIRDFFPNAPIIHIVRDGRDVAESLARMHWQKGSYLNGLMLWKNRIRKAETFMVSDKKSKNIRFEDLIRDPDQTVKSICDFLGLKFEPDMLVPDGSESNLIELGMKHKELIKEPINTDKLQVWKKILPVESQQLATMIIRDDLRRWNYENSYPISRSAIRIWTSIGMYNSAQASAYHQLILQLFRNHFEIKATVINSVDEKLPRQKANMYIIAGPLRKFTDDMKRSYRKATFFLSTLYNFIRLQFLKIPIIWVYHADADRIKRIGRYERYLERILVFFADFTVCPCIQNRCEFSKTFPKHISKVLHINDDLFKHLNDRFKLTNS